MGKRQTRLRSENRNTCATNQILIKSQKFIKEVRVRIFYEPLAVMAFTPNPMKLGPFIWKPLVWKTDLEKGILSESTLFNG